MINKKDLLSGVLFMAFGALGLTVGTQYELGTISRMGPGYFPVVISCILSLVGAVISVKAIWSGREDISWGRPRPVFLVIASIVASGLLIEASGLAIASFPLIALIYIAAGQVRFVELGILYLVFLSGVVLLFVNVLKLPLKVFPGL